MVKKKLITAIMFISTINIVYAQKIPPVNAQKNPPSIGLASKVPYIYPNPTETAAQRETRMEWWHQAKFGMFIHFGLYAIPADGEWHMRTHHEPLADYSKLASEFNPVKFNADEWMQIAHDAGMKYLVITSKHHDGFAMFKSNASAYNLVDATPFKRDVLKELSMACPRHDIRFGVYYSAAADWGHPGGGAGEKKWDPAQEGDYDEYINKIAVPQVRELLTNYGPINELWFDNDGSPGMTPERANRIFEQVKLQPKVIVDPRLGSGDFDTEEQHISPLAPLRDWEACLTVAANNSWGYTHAAPKTLRLLLLNLVNVFGKGGNVLLNVGPTPEGLIAAGDVQRLKEVGQWMKVNGEAVYGTVAGPFDYLSFGSSTRKGNMLYLFVSKWPKNGVLNLPLTTSVKKAYLVANKQSLNCKLDKGRTVLYVPSVAPDSIVSVIALELKGEPNLVKSLALNKPVKASVNSNAAGTTVDNNPASRWKPGKDIHQCWLEVDLLCPQSVSTLRVGDNFCDIKKFILEYQENGQWKTACEGENMARDDYSISFSPVTGQIFRFRIIESSGELTISSLEFFPPE